MKLPFANRRIEPELLDHASVEDARANLAQIVRLNQHFGGHSVLRKLLAQAVNGNPAFTMLDIGAASGDTARLVNQIYPAATVTSVDLNPTNLADAPHPKLLADAFQLPFKPASFDYVFCSLFLHHFEDRQVSNLMAGFYRLARRALVISDLERHILPYLFFPATKPFFGWTPMTMHDGMCSIRAAFRAGELGQLARNAGLVNPQVEIHRTAFRLALVAVKSSAG
jgi:2-polyprenyl-3-methyl-5-hydroxy-6-metoxy-1,4-benzoquinol methylase